MPEKTDIDKLLDIVDLMSTTMSSVPQMTGAVPAIKALIIEMKAQMVIREVKKVKMITDMLKMSKTISEIK